MNKPSKYGDVAIKAALLAKGGINPIEAWQTIAAEIFIGTPSAEKKNCPKSAFLGLAEAGLIKGVACGAYTKSKDNKKYALYAIELLRSDKSWSESPKELWSQVTVLTGKKQHNHQMDVVLALWHGKCLADTTPNLAQTNGSRKNEAHN